MWVKEQNIKARHLRRDPRATILLAVPDPPLRAIEVRGPARFIEDGVSETARRSPEARSLARERACLGLARFAGVRWRASDAICAHRPAIPAYATWALADCN